MYQPAVSDLREAELLLDHPERMRKPGSAAGIDVPEPIGDERLDRAATAAGSGQQIVAQVLATSHTPFPLASRFCKPDLSLHLRLITQAHAWLRLHFSRRRLPALSGSVVLSAITMNY
ncbi:hypothetical protein [Cupriavidus lacunae]|uniref:hypothetical protein n=1 Tax=Cupriavidus lacunae TaxID=2666307 RepID=UPI001374E8F2